MKLGELFKSITSSQDINYFIIDSGQHASDDDFKSYTWNRSRNNKIRPNDVFIYRKPQKLSDNGQFNFYGCGQFESVDGVDYVIAPIINAHPFERPILQSELSDFRWEWKKRGDN